jgi:hypothetical protein
MQQLNTTHNKVKDEGGRREGRRGQIGRGRGEGRKGEGGKE